MPWLEPVTLRGAHARLEPLSHDHRDALVEAVRDGELWKLWYTSVPKPEAMGKEIDRRLGLQAAGSMLPFTVFDAEGRISGMTTYMNVDAANRRVEIGSTWYAVRAQRSALNTQCKLLLLTHAFETLDCIAVEFRTHFFNHQSRRGIERLGAKRRRMIDSAKQSRATRGTLDCFVASLVAMTGTYLTNHHLFKKFRGRPGRGQSIAISSPLPDSVM